MERKKSLLFLVFGVIWATNLFSQEYIEIVKTNDGSIFRGVIVDNILNKSIKIELSDGSIVNIEYENIFSIGKEKATDNSAPENVNKKPKSNRRPTSWLSGYRGQYSIGGFSTNNLFSTKMALAWGYYQLEFGLLIGSYWFYESEPIFAPGFSIANGLYIPLKQWGAVIINLLGVKVQVLDVSGMYPDISFFANIGMRLYALQSKALTFEILAGAGTGGLLGLYSSGILADVTISIGYSWLSGEVSR